MPWSEMPYVVCHCTNKVVTAPAGRGGGAARTVVAYFLKLLYEIRRDSSREFSAPRVPGRSGFGDGVVRVLLLCSARLETPTLYTQTRCENCETSENHKTRSTHRPMRHERQAPPFPQTSPRRSTYPKQVTACACMCLCSIPLASRSRLTARPRP